MTIKSISFDLDDTLWPLMPTILKAEETTNKWIADNYPGTSSLLKSKDVIQIRDKLIKQKPNLVNQISDLRKEMFYELNVLAGYSKEESIKMSEEAFDIYFKQRNTITFYKDALKTLKLLKKNYSLGVITNGNANLKKIGIDHLFDYIFSAADLNAHKPDPSVFQAAIDITGLSPNEICHVGDHPINDVQGSYDCGLNPIWFNESGKEWPIKEFSVAEFSEWNEFESVLEKNF